jgi:hypothetical protein
MYYSRLHKKYKLEKILLLDSSIEFTSQGISWKNHVRTEDCGVLRSRSRAILFPGARTELLCIEMINTAFFYKDQSQSQNLKIFTHRSR